MKTCLIFGAGETDGTEPLPAAPDLVIAADGGLDAALSRGLTPDLCIGDFDSAAAAPPPGSEVIRLPREKDETDSAAAAEEALRRGCGRLLFYGMLGGRPDHSFANLSLLAALSARTEDVRMYGLGYEITAVTNGAYRAPAREKGTVSVFSFSDESEGVTIRGLYYPLENARLTNGTALGISNECTGSPFGISVRKGTLLIMTDFLRSV